MLLNVYNIKSWKMLEMTILSNNKDVGKVHILLSCYTTKEKL